MRPIVSLGEEAITSFEYIDASEVDLIWRVWWRQIRYWKGLEKMIQSVFKNIHVSGIMTAVPKYCENIMEKYEPIFGSTAVESFSKNVGVLERRIASEEQTASDLAFVAARELLEKKVVDKKQIGILVFVTQTPDYRVPATACVLHKRLGLWKDCLAFDVNLGCSGYVYGMQIVCSLLKSTGCKYGLLLAGDTSSKGIAPEDQSVTMLFGDGGSATLLETQKNAEYIHIACRTDGSKYKAIIMPSGCFRNIDGERQRSVWADGNKRSDYDLYMNGVDVFAFSISEVPVMIKDFLKTQGTDKDTYDDYFFHQANCYILKQITKKCRLIKDKVAISMDRYGNTSVTSIPLTICDKYGNEIGGKKRNLLTCGFGIGLSWGIASFELDQNDIYPILETDEYYECETNKEWRG